MCNHPIHQLMGTADGIVCRACGAKFKSFEELQAGADAPEKKATPKAKKEKK